MNKYLILVKHSLPEIMENRPACEWELSDQGRERAQRLAERLRHFQPEVIVSSNEPKAKETAQIIAKMHQLEWCVVEDLHEHDRSNVPYLTRDEFEALVREFFQNPDVLIFGKETANHAHARFERAVHSILNSHANKTLVLVAHGTVISLFVSRLTGISDQLLWMELGLPSFVVIDPESRTLVARENIV